METIGLVYSFSVFWFLSINTSKRSCFLPSKGTRDTWACLSLAVPAHSGLNLKGSPVEITIIQKTASKNSKPYRRKHKEGFPTTCLSRT